MEASEIARRNEAIEKFNETGKRKQGWLKNDQGEVEWNYYPARAFHEDWNLLMPVVEKISLDTEVHLAFRPMGPSLKPLCHASAGQKSIHSYMDGNLW